MIKILIFILFIFLSQPFCFSQKTIDAVYLQDGSIIKGKILEKDSDNLKIETLCKSIMVFPLSKVSNTATEFYNRSNLKTKGYFNFTSFGTLIGSSHNDKSAPFSFLIENNYRFNRYFTLGHFTGIEMLNETTVPLGINFKVLLSLSKGNTLYAGMNGGYSFSLEKPKVSDYDYPIKNAYGGYMYNTEVGLIFPSGGNTGIFIAVGYRYNQLNYKREDWWLNRVDRTIYYNRLSIRAGLTIY